MSFNTQSGIAEFEPPPLPKNVVNIRSDHWKRVSRALYCISVLGLSLQKEIAELAGFPFPSGTASDVFQTLVREQLVERSVIRFNSRWKVGLVRLSAIGKLTCTGWLGWTVVESEWERVLRLHQGNDQPRHTAALLSFAYQARKRGYQVIVLPEVENTLLVPDLKVMRGEEQLYVEVEMMDRGFGRKDRTWVRKWQNQFANQGYVAFCTITSSRRLKMTSELKKLWRGYATDLTTLRKQSNTAQDLSELWAEKWSWK